MSRGQTPCRCALLTALVALALTGCTDVPTSTREGRTLRLTVDEYAITPQDVSVPPGRLTLVLRNRGRLTHDVHVRVPSEEPGEQPVDLGGTSTAQPGATARGTLTLRPGTYELVCTIQNHDVLGERGTLVVRER
jgi:plastocyanin